MHQPKAKSKRQLVGRLDKVKKEKAPITSNNMPAKAGIQTGIRAKSAETNIYECGLLENEKGKVYHEIVNKIGTLDQEIHMARVFLRRAFLAQKRQDEARELLVKYENDPDKWIEIAAKYHYITITKFETKQGSFRETMTPEIRREFQDKSYKRITRNKTDYSNTIRKYTNIIKNLEAQRKELMENQKDVSEEFIAAIADDLRSFTTAIAATMPRNTEFGKGNYGKLKKAVEDEETDE